MAIWFAVCYTAKWRVGKTYAQSLYGKCQRSKLLNEICQEAKGVTNDDEKLNDAI